MVQLSSTWILVAPLLFGLVPFSTEALTFTKREASSGTHAAASRYPLVPKWHPFELITQLRYRTVDYENEIDYYTASMTPFSIPIQPQDTQNSIQKLSTVEQERGHQNTQDMDQYLESIYRRYKRLYDYNNGDALKVFSSTTTTTSSPSASFVGRKGKRHNKIRVWIALVFQHWGY